MQLTLLRRRLKKLCNTGMVECGNCFDGAGAMPKQLTLAAGPTFERIRKPTRRDVFLAEMNKGVPWKQLVALIEPHYPKPSRKGRRPSIGIERMLRIHCLRHWFNLSDPAVQESLYDSASLRSFVGIDLEAEPVPDETTTLRFRHPLEQHHLGRKIFEEVGQVLQSKGLKLSTGTIVDATIIAAPSSTKNEDKARDPEMHLTKKGNEWHFGMKADVGVDSQSKLIHSVAATAANVADSTVLPQLLHGREDAVWGDQAYRGQAKAIAKVAPKARDLTNQRYRFRGHVDEIERLRNQMKSTIRSRIEHSTGVFKRIFGFRKVRYRGLTTNGNRLFVVCALSNLFMARGHLMLRAT